MPNTMDHSVTTAPEPQRRAEADASRLRRAGVARAEIGDDAGGGTVDAPLYTKALVLEGERDTLAVITVDAVALAEIGPLRDDFLGRIRDALRHELGLTADRILLNASHCHGRVREDCARIVVETVRRAWESRVPVRVGAGTGYEDRIMENRRLELKSGRVVDVRHAYSLPPDDEVVAVGPVDPDIPLLRLDREDGTPLAALFSFACHPIQGVPDGGNTADIAGFAAQMVEVGLGSDAIVLFLQGCGGDVNPILYKDVDHPRDAEPLGNKLGLSTLRALRGVECRADASLNIVTESLALPRSNPEPRIRAMEAERDRLVQSLKGTTLNLKSFLHLMAKYQAGVAFPSAPSHRYLRDEALSRKDWERLDALNRQSLRHYADNILAMEELTRIQTNLNLLRMHQRHHAEAGTTTLDIQLLAARIGDFALLGFPGELSVRIGLNIKAISPHPVTCVAGCSNGYIYYAPTAEQLRNPGSAQEDCDTLLAPEWQHYFEKAANDILRRL